MFPAYGERNAESQENNSRTSFGGVNIEKFDWLQNASFQPENVENLELLAREATHLKEALAKPEEIVDFPTAEKHPGVERAYEKRRKESKRRKHRPRSRSPTVEARIEENLRSAVTSGKKVFIEDVSLAPEHAFRIDHNADRNNLAFTSLPHQHIADYKRSLRCLGMSADCRESWLTFALGKSRHKKNQHKKVGRYHDCLKVLYDETKIIDLSKPWLRFDKHENEQLLRNHYWPLAKPSIKVDSSIDSASHSVNPLGIYDPNTSSYLQGKGPAVTDDVPVSSSTPEEPSYKETSEQYHERTKTDFNRYLRECPDDVNRWIEFVRFQDEAIEFSLTSKTVAQRGLVEKAILEKKLAIMDKAIENNPKSVELLAMKVELCRDVWDSERLMSEWKRILFVHPNSTLLWKKYLQFFQTNFTTFTVSKFGRLFSKCFDMLNKIKSGSFQSHRPLQHLEEHMLEIFCYYCHVLCNSGFRERAIANFQALIEFNFFVPDTLLNRAASLENWLAFFEPFWDSGVPRFGEEGSKGWGHAMKEKELKIPSGKFEVSFNEESLLKASASLSENWLNLEQSRESQHWSPWRPSEFEDECEDPDRSVLFDDVSAGLFHLEKDRTKFLLVVHFLHFLGVRVEPHCQSACEYLECHQPSLITDERQILGHSQGFRWRFYTNSRTETTLGVSDAMLLPNNPQYEAFLDRVFEQSSNLFSGSHYKEFVSLWLKHKCKFLDSPTTRNAKQIKDAKKFAKNLLKNSENRNDLRLWTEYAKLEWIGGNIQEARKVFNISLTSRGSWDWNVLGAEELRDLCYVHRVSTELELGITDGGAHSDPPCDGRERALQILVHLGSNGKHSLASHASSTVTSATILKVRNHYKVTLEKLLGDYSAADMDNNELRFGWHCGHLLTEWTICCALFEYATEEQLPAANVIYSSVIQQLETCLKDNLLNKEQMMSSFRNRYNCELLYVHYVLLQMTHNNNHISAPIKAIRDVLSKAMSTFSENCQFSSLFLDIEIKSHIAGRLRRYYDNRLKDSSHPGCVSAIYAIIAELERQKNLLESQALAMDLNLQDANPSSVGLETGITHRLRALFQRIVQCSTLQSCVLLWRLYLKFEVMQGNLKEGKTVFYRALQHCPWAKVLYFDAIQYFPDDFQEISDILIEKEIRVRAPLEEVSILLGSDVSQDTTKD